MAALFDNCLKYFHSRCLYEVLGAAKNASANDVKKAYYKMSLKVHPDRANEETRVLATEKFQILGRVYAILSDQDKRDAYDETGCVDDEDCAQERDWDSYWRLLFKNVTFEDIEKFKKKYQDSEEECNDLKDNYKMFKGDMDKIMDHLPCAEMDDEPRLREILVRCIKENEILDYPAFTKETKSKREKRKKRFIQEAAEAEQLKHELGLGKTIDTTNSLADAIMKRQETREKEMDSFLAGLEAKYGNKAKKARNAEAGTKSQSSKQTMPLNGKTSTKTRTVNADKKAVSKASRKRQK